MKYPRQIQKDLSSRLFKWFHYIYVEVYKYFWNEKFHHVYHFIFPLWRVIFIKLLFQRTNVNIFVSGAVGKYICMCISANRNLKIVCAKNCPCSHTIIQDKAYSSCLSHVVFPRDSIEDMEVGYMLYASISLYYDQPSSREYFMKNHNWIRICDRKEHELYKHEFL